jgi:prepilin-type N-terminal cleavage/methylation domain-containing protein
VASTEIIYPPIWRRQGGFSAIEMITVVALVGILAGIGVSQFTAYRKRSYETQVKQGLNDAVKAQQSFFTANGSYKSGSLTSGDPPGFNRTQAVTLTAVAGENSFQLTATHALCGSTTWTLDSSDGRISGGPCDVEISLLPQGCN